MSISIDQLEAITQVTWATMTNQRPVSPVDHDGDGQGEDEDAGEGAEAANQLPQQRLGVELVTHCRDGHQAPPADNKNFS